MFRTTLMGAAMLMLAACDPMHSVPRFSEAQVDPNAPALSVLSREDAADLIDDAAAASGHGPAEEIASRAVATPVPKPVQEDNADRGEGFLASLFGVRHDAIAVPDMAPGAKVPFEGLARVCDMPDDLGTEVARTMNYVIYDSHPDSARPRAFFMTGFADGCARKFTAAMAMFGDVETYERIRFGAAADTQPMSDTDHAYDKIKTRVCRAGADAPCGDRLDRLARDTIFVSVYERFGSNPRWKNLLLHDGAVMAMDIKTL